MWSNVKKYAITTLIPAFISKAITDGKNTTQDDSIRMVRNIAKLRGNLLYVKVRMRLRSCLAMWDSLANVICKSSIMETHQIPKIRIKVTVSISGL